jgi:transcriptional regulator with XRE-family HTH domain
VAKLRSRPKPSDDSLGLRIRTARLASGLTFQQIAERAKVNPSSLWRYESEAVMPGAETLRRLAEAFDCNPQWLLCGTGRPQDPPEPVSQAVIRLTPALMQLLCSLAAISAGELALLSDTSRRKPWLSAYDLELALLEHRKHVQT